MPSGITLNAGIVVGSPIPLDAKYGPYDSVALALADLSTAIRHQGLTVGIKDGGSIVEYWFKDGVADANFVEKVVAANWDTLLNKPSTFPPAIHSHAISDVTNLQSSLDSKVGLKTYYSVVMIGESSKSFSLPANETNIEVRVGGFAVPSGIMTINLAADAPTGSLVTIITDGWSAFNQLVVQVPSSEVLVNETYTDPQGSFDRIWYFQKEGGWANISNDLIPKPNWSALSGSRNEILNKPTLGTAASANATDFASANLVGSPVEYVIACSDETTALTAGTAKVTFRAPVAFRLTSVSASVTVAPTGSTLVVDINNGPNSVLSTELSIDIGAKTSATAATPAVINTSFRDFAADAEITVDLVQPGSLTAGAGLKVILRGTRQ